MCFSSLACTIHRLFVCVALLVAVAEAVAALPTGSTHLGLGASGIVIVHNEGFVSCVCVCCCPRRVHLTEVVCRGWFWDCRLGSGLVLPTCLLVPILTGDATTWAHPALAPLVANATNDTSRTASSSGGTTQVDIVTGCTYNSLFLFFSFFFQITRQINFTS